jgi:Ring finger domain
MKFFLLLILQLTVQNGIAASYSTKYPCTIDDMPVVVLRQDVKSGNMSVYKRLQPNADINRDEFNETGQIRMLTMEDMTVMVTDNDPSFLFGYHRRLGSQYYGDNVIMRGLSVHDATIATTNATAAINNVSYDDYVYFFARECNCFETWSPVVYCPMTIDTCLRGTWSTPPGCRNMEQRQSFAWSIQMLSLAGFVVLVFSCFQREGLGSNARDRLLSFCIPRYRDRLADRILQHNPRRALQLYRSSLLQQGHEGRLQQRQSLVSIASATSVLRPEQVVTSSRQRQVQQEVELRGIEQPQVPSGNDTNNSRSLLLRTSIYRQSSVDESHDEACAICFAELIDGDRVGVLEVCQHQFHVECLKPWLQRRNTCPLCQKEGIAKPQYYKHHTSSEVTSLGSSIINQGPPEDGENQTH